MTWQPFAAQDVDRVFTTESRQKDERLFALTHAPMRRILVTHNRVGLSNGDFIGEQHLLQVIQEGQPGSSNRVWFLVGETGSGKSELCQWLEYRLRETHVPIHISRRQANLTGILDVLLRHLPHAPRQTTTVPPDVLSDHLRMHLQLRAHREGHFQHAVQDLLSWCPVLVERLYSASGAHETLLDGLPDRPAGFPLEAWLMGAAREVLGVQSLEGLLRGVVEVYQGQNKRPVLLLEDITTLGFLRDDLLDYIFDLSAPGFDAVIGLTTGFEQSHLSEGVDLAEMAYVRDRLSARFQLSNASGETFFLSQPQDLHELVRRYLACLTLAPSAPPEAQHPVFEGLYPLTPTMLDRLYLHLVESGNIRQTPRNLLDAVIRPALTMPEVPHVSLFRPHPYLRAPSITFYRQQLPDDLAALFYWHGVADGDVITVPEDVARAFGHVELPVVRGFQQPVGTTHLFHSVAAPDPTEEWQEALAELQSWQKGADTFPKRQNVKRGFERLARMLGEPRQVAHPHLNASSADPLEFTRGGEALPIHLPDSGDSLPEHWPSIHLPRTTSTQFLEECLNYAFTSAQHVEVLADPGGTREVVQRHLQAFQEELRAHLQYLLGMPYEDLVLGLWWLCQHITLTRPLAPEEAWSMTALLTYDLGPGHAPKKAWQAGRPHLVLHRTLQEMTALRASYRALFISVFHHRDDIVDAGLLQERWATFDPAAFLQNLANLNLKRVLNAPFRQKRTQHSLQDLVRPAQEYAAALLVYPAADADEEGLTLALGQLEHVLTHAEDLDRGCREVERLAHRLGLAVQAPPTSHQWRHTRWEQVRGEATAVADHLAPLSPLIGITVRRAWLESLDEAAPLVWLSEVRTFLVLVNNMLVARHGGPRMTTRANPPYAVRLGDLERLMQRLQKQAQALEEVAEHVHHQFMTCVTALSQVSVPEIQALAAEVLVTPPDTKDEHLQVACQLLKRTTDQLRLLDTKGGSPNAVL